MANESFLHLNPRDVIAPSGGAPAPEITVGLGRGLAFPDGQTSSVLFVARVPETVALATGLTFSLLFSDDPLNADPGRVAAFGITVGPITSGTSTFDENASTGPLHASTEATGTVTLPGTSGVLTIMGLAVPIASMTGLAAGGWCLIRVRRLGSSTSDTHRGRVVLLGVDTRNT